MIKNHHGTQFTIQNYTVMVLAFEEERDLATEVVRSGATLSNMV